jgi:hypothetical protein
MRRTTAALALIILVSVGAASANDREPISSEMAFLPDLAGRWEEPNWGVVTLRLSDDGRGYEGTYSSTFGKDVGRLSVSFSRRSGVFEGTWSEGTYRFGRLALRVAESRRLAKGSYSADAKCEYAPGVPASYAFEWKKGAK